MDDVPLIVTILFSSVVGAAILALVIKYFIDYFKRKKAMPSHEDKKDKDHK